MNKVEFALKYASMGLKVFPVVKGTKGAPQKNGKSGQLVKSWKREATSDKEIIRQWWEKWPDADICICTGGGLTVIDMDVKHPPVNGIEVVNDWQFENKVFPRTAMSESASGGRHLYYWTSSDFKSKNNFMDGVDIKSQGGYVVAPPSEGYKWLNELSIAEANDAVLMFLLGKKLQGKPMEETPEGSRNDTMTKQIWKLIHEYSKEEALSIALSMNQECAPPLEDELIKSMVERAYSKVIKEKTAGVINLQEIEPEEIEWLWYPYIPKGKITIIAGEAGVSKTFLECELAAIVSTGRSFYGEEETRRGGIVCIQNTEDGLADTIVKRLRAAKADLSMIKSIDTSEKLLSFDDPRIDDFLERYHPDLMIFDPFQSFFGPGVDLNRSNEIRPVFDKLLNKAQKYNVAIVLIMHLSKMTGAKAINRVLGSADIVGAVRSVLIVVNNPNIDGRKLISHEKSNLAPKGESISYYIENSAIVWDGFSNMTADDCMTATKQKKEKSKLDMATDLIESRLKETGRAKAKDIYAAAEDIGISKSTIKKARTNLDLVDEREGFGKDSIVYWTYS